MAVDLLSSSFYSVLQLLISLLQRNLNCNLAKAAKRLREQVKVKPRIKTFILPIVVILACNFASHSVEGFQSCMTTQVSLTGSSTSTFCNPETGNITSQNLRIQTF